MRRLLIVVLCLLLLPAYALADAPRFVWVLRLGGDGVTEAKAMTNAGQDGLFVAGYTDSAGTDLGVGLGGRDGLLLRVDASGGIRWQKRLGGSDDDVFTDVLVMPDGGCIAMGTTASRDGDARASRGGVDAWIVRLDADGETLWSKCLGGSLDDELTVIRYTQEGQIFACGRTQSRNGDLSANYGGWDAWAILLSGEDGKPIWTYRQGYDGDDKFTNAYPVGDGWLLLGEIAEEEETTGQDDEVEIRHVQRQFVQRLDSQGEQYWESPVLLGDTGINSLFQVIEAETGFLLAGETNSRSAMMPTAYGGMDIWVLRLRQNGTVAWQWTYGGSRDERLHSVYTAAEGGYFLLCETNSENGQVYGAHGQGSDVWVVKISGTGVLEWQQPLGGTGVSTATGLVRLEDGRILVAGTTVSQDGDMGRHASDTTGFLSVLATNGNLVRTEVLEMGIDTSLQEICVSEDGHVFLMGALHSGDGKQTGQSLLLARWYDDTAQTKATR